MKKGLKAKVIFFIIILFIISCDNSEETEAANYTFGSITLLNGIDLDSDGFYRSVDLNIDVNIDPDDSREIYLRFLYRQTATENIYTLYLKSNNFIVQGNSDADIFTVDLNGDSILQGTYDFKIEIYEPSTPHTPKAVATTGFAIERVKIEPPNLDNTPVSIFSITWSNKIDLDADGYLSSASLNIDVDVVSQAETIKINTYYKLNSSSNYEIYNTTSIFTIFAQSRTDSRSITIGNSTELLIHDVYDFRVEVLNTKDIILVSVDNISILNNQLFETTGEDI